MVCAVILVQVYGVGFGMGSEITVAALGAGRVLQAYPLVRETAPSITLEAWCSFARSILRERRRIGNACGITAACSENDYLRGLFSYRVGPDIQHGRALIVECFAVSGLFSPHAVAAALLDGVDETAIANHCNAVHAELPAQPDWLGPLLAERGYVCRPCSLCKPLNKPAMAPAGGGPPFVGAVPKTPASPSR